MTISIDKLIALHIELRDRRDALEEEHKARLAPIRERMGQIEQALQMLFNAQGTDKATARGVGTAYTSEVMNLKATDKDAVWAFVLEHDRPDLLQWSVNKTAFRKLEAEGVQIPGVEVSRAKRMNVRRV